MVEEYALAMVVVYVGGGGLDRMLVMLKMDRTRIESLWERFKITLGSIFCFQT